MFCFRNEGRQPGGRTHLKEAGQILQRVPSEIHAVAAKSHLHTSAQSRLYEVCRCFGTACVARCTDGHNNIGNKKVHHQSIGRGKYSKELPVLEQPFSCVFYAEKVRPTSKTFAVRSS